MVGVVDRPCAVEPGAGRGGCGPQVEVEVPVSDPVEGVFVHAGVRRRDGDRLPVPVEGGVLGEEGAHAAKVKPIAA